MNTLLVGVNTLFFSYHLSGVIGKFLKRISKKTTYFETVVCIIAILIMKHTTPENPPIDDDDIHGIDFITVHP